MHGSLVANMDVLNESSESGLFLFTGFKGKMQLACKKMLYILKLMNMNFNSNVPATSRLVPALRSDSWNMKNELVLSAGRGGMAFQQFKLSEVMSSCLA